MDELFVMLCAGVAAALESLKPAIKTLLRIEDTTSRLYQAAVWLVAMLVGIAGAFAFQVNMAPAWLTLPDVAGRVFTGIVAAFGSEVGHRILEVLAALSLIMQRQAVKPHRP